MPCARTGWSTGPTLASLGLDMLLRLVRLEMVGRLRAVGVVPWLAFLAWVLIARFQEPTVLRSFGISLLDQAAWGAAVILLDVFLVIPIYSLHRKEGRACLPGPVLWPFVLSNLLLVVLLAVFQALVSSVVEWGMGGTLDGHATLLRIGWFLLAWTPLALVASRWSRGMGAIAVAFDAICFMLCGSVAVRAIRDESGVLPAAGLLLVGAVLVLLGTTCTLAARQPHPSMRAAHANRHPRRHSRER